MAIATRTRPEMLIFGVLNRTRAIQARQADDSGRRPYYGESLEVETAGGGVQVNAWERDLPHPGEVGGGFSVGQVVAIVVTVTESRQNGADLSFVRFADADDVRQVAEAAGVKAA
ncbi:hypothetical protein ACFOYW_15335 [Gryllotalpicola reticulitermitis]|uniref:Single-stranded DNA-binding protein n=1 Tax=Gryllotalpicola reticulitermitis TaxID=1184153 RepID=A0ABV8QBC1_9MICO